MAVKIFVKTIGIGAVLVAALILVGCSTSEEQASQEEQSVEETTEETAEETTTEDTTLAEATVEEETVVTAQTLPQAAEAPQLQTTDPNGPYYHPPSGPCLGQCTDAYGRNNADLQSAWLAEQGISPQASPPSSPDYDQFKAEVCAARRATGTNEGGQPAPLPAFC